MLPPPATTTLPGALRMPPDSTGPVVTSGGNGLFLIHQRRYSALTQIGGAGRLTRHCWLSASRSASGSAIAGKAGCSADRRASGPVSGGKLAGAGDCASAKPALASMAVSEPRNPLLMLTPVCHLPVRTGPATGTTSIARPPGTIRLTDKRVR